MENCCPQGPEMVQTLSLKEINGNLLHFGEAELKVLIMGHKCRCIGASDYLLKCLQERLVLSMKCPAP